MIGEPEEECVCVCVCVRACVRACVRVCLCLLCVCTHIVIVKHFAFAFDRF